jgi:hypothetical protein
MALRRLLAQAIAVLAFATAPAVADNSRAEIQHTIDPKTNIESWQMQDNGIEVTLIQIGSDQARGFFLARGFKRADVDYYAASCVIATVVRNRSSSPISYHLANWRYEKGDGVARKLKPKDDWLREWKQRGVSSSARIAFEWSQHPAGQTLEPSDWNQGMTTYQVSHGSRFDLTVKWKAGKSNYVDTIKDIRCAD